MKIAIGILGCIVLILIVILVIVGFSQNPSNIDENMEN